MLPEGRRPRCFCFPLFLVELLDKFLLPENFDIRIKSNFKHEAIKRLSLPTDIRLPDEILAKFARDNPALASGGGGENLTRKNRRASLVRNIFLK